MEIGLGPDVARPRLRGANSAPYKSLPSLICMVALGRVLDADPIARRAALALAYRGLQVLCQLRKTDAMKSALQNLSKYFVSNSIQQVSSLPILIFSKPN